MNKKILILGFVFAIFLFSLIAGCTKTEEAEKETICIGLATPLTGSLATLGETVKNSASIALEEINSAGGINGKPLEIIFEDTKGELAPAVSAVQKLITVDGVSAYIEAASGGEAAATAPIGQEAGIVHYSVFATTEALIDAGDYVFKMREGTLPHAKAVIDAMKKEEVKSVGILHRSDEYCSNMLKNFLEQAELAGIEIAATEKYQTEDTDFRSQISKLKDTTADGIWACGFYKDLGLVFKQLHELETGKKLFSVTTFEHNLVKQNAGAEAIEGTIYSVSPLDCKRAKEFCEKYEEKTGHAPDYRAAFAYDAVHIVAKALKQGTTADELKEILLTIEHDGATGITKFDEKGNSQKEVILHQVKDGEWAPYP